MGDGGPADVRAREGRWKARPAASLSVRVLALLLPTVAGVATATAIGSRWEQPPGAGAVVWWVGLLACSGFVALAVERLARRFLPLAVLLRLSLVFPDRAPSRFAVARGAWSVRRLEERVRAAREGSLDDDPAQAAAQILRLVAALSAHDRKTRGHSERVRVFTDLLADEMGLPQHDRDRLRWAALLHDIGKLRVPTRILNKAGRPDPYEWEVLQQHPAEGETIAAPLLPWLGVWADTIRQHHERYDGRGYPSGLSGGEIGMGARIVAVADSFEVMTAARAYKKPLSVPAARRELIACAGSQFDPAVVRSFLSVSLGRLWWTVGPSAWVATVPALGWVQRATEQAVIAAKSAAVVSAIGVVTALDIGALPGAAAATGPVGGPSAATDPPGITGVTTGPTGAEGSGGKERDRTEDPEPEPDPSPDPKPDPSPSPSPSPSPGGGTVRPVEDAVDAVDETVKDLGGTVDDLLGGATSRLF
jgi:putative nucleotidyltransferase with HDIG domain